MVGQNKEKPGQRSFCMTPQNTATLKLLYVLQITIMHTNVMQLGNSTIFGFHKHFFLPHTPWISIPHQADIKAMKMG